MLQSRFGPILLLVLTCCAGGGSGGDDEGQEFARYAYVANFFEDSVSTYAVDDSTGYQRFVDVVPAGDEPRSASVDPLNRFVYVANGNDDTVSQYRIGVDGGLAPLATPTIAAGNAPSFVAIVGGFE